MDRGDSFGSRLNRLFAAQQSKTGIEMSMSRFLEEFKEQTGMVLSKGYLSDLRNDLAPEPRLDLVRAFTEYFQVDPSYFMVSSRKQAEEIAARGELSDALQAFGATELAFRTTGLSATSILHIAQIIDSVRSLEGLPPIENGPDAAPGREAR